MSTYLVITHKYAIEIAPQGLKPKCPPSWTGLPTRAGGFRGQRPSKGDFSRVLTLDQAIGHILQHLVAQKKRLRALEKGESSDSQTTRPPDHKTTRR